MGMGKSTRGVELESVDDLDERQIAAWMKHVASVITGSMRCHTSSTVATGSCASTCSDAVRPTWDTGETWGALVDVLARVGRGQRW
ncbi:hypothetical protein BH09ACT6_BH09ACT6_10980 [soil metagenome]